MPAASRVARRRRGSGAIADEPRPGGEVTRIEQPRDGHGNKLRVGNVPVAIGVHETARLRKQKPGFRIGGATLGDIGVIENAQELQERHTARGRRWHTHGVLLVRPAQGLTRIGAVACKILERHRARKRRLVRALYDLRSDAACVECARPLSCDPDKHVRVLGIAKQIPSAQRLPVGPHKKRPHIRRRRKREVR